MVEQQASGQMGWRSLPAHSNHLRQNSGVCPTCCVGPVGGTGHCLQQGTHLVVGDAFLQGQDRGCKAECVPEM